VVSSIICTVPPESRQRAIRSGGSASSSSSSSSSSKPGPLITVEGNPPVLPPSQIVQIHLLCA
jgi:hypothetical protein